MYYSRRCNSQFVCTLSVYCAVTSCIATRAHTNAEPPIKHEPNELHGYTVHQTMLKPFYYQLMHIMLKNTELLKHSKITLQHVSVYVETIFREPQSVLGQKLHI